MAGNADLLDPGGAWHDPSVYVVAEDGGAPGHGDGDHRCQSWTSLAATSNTSPEDCTFRSPYRTAKANMIVR